MLGYNTKITKSLGISIFCILFIFISICPIYPFDISSAVNFSPLLPVVSKENIYKNNLYKVTSYSASMITQTQTYEYKKHTIIHNIETNQWQVIYCAPQIDSLEKYHNIDFMPGEVFSSTFNSYEEAKAFVDKHTSPSSIVPIFVNYYKDVKEFYEGWFGKNVEVLKKYKGFTIVQDIDSKKIYIACGQSDTTEIMYGDTSILKEFNSLEDAENYIDENMKIYSIKEAIDKAANYRDFHIVLTQDYKWQVNYRIGNSLENKTFNTIGEAISWIDKRSDANSQLVPINFNKDNDKVFSKYENGKLTNSYEYKGFVIREGIDNESKKWVHLYAYPCGDKTDICYRFNSVEEAKEFVDKNALIVPTQYSGEITKKYANFPIIYTKDHKWQVKYCYISNVELDKGIVTIDNSDVLLASTFNSYEETIAFINKHTSPSSIIPISLFGGYCTDEERFYKNWFGKEVNVVQIYKGFTIVQDRESKKIYVAYCSANTKVIFYGDTSILHEFNSIEEAENYINENMFILAPDENR